MIENLIGFLAGALTTISFVPQVIKVWKSKSTKDISLGMFLLFTIGVSLWLAYGLWINDPPIIVANLVTVVLAILILIAKLRFG